MVLNNIVIQMGFGCICAKLDRNPLLAFWAQYFVPVNAPAVIV